MEDQWAAKKEFAALVVYLFFALSALGYILLLCSKDAGGMSVILCSGTLFLLLLFTLVAPVTSGAEKLFPFFGRFLIGLGAAAYPVTVLIAASVGKQHRSDGPRGGASNDETVQTGLD